ncbi:MAG: 4-hydroxy-tetrahydrodipicolinate synthase [Alphaproteobacteria bacterium]|nr:4-hydroxy-tetrahydrodipicolinate synthase [Alphaproteobacteria bacterium]
MPIQDSRSGPPGRDRSRLEGLWLPLMTPFRDGKLDEPTVSALARRYIAAPIDGLILAATTGEALTLDAEELERLVALVAEANAGRRPVYLGLSGSDTRKLAHLLAATRRWPIDGYLIACPYYTRPSQDGLYLHFATLAELSDKPIALYNIPYRTGVNLANETVLRLAEFDTIVGIKDCCAVHEQSFELLRRRPAGFSVMTGEDALFFSAIAHGADGGILASAHVDPRGFAEMRSLLLSGDRAAALRLWGGLSEVVSLLFAEPSPAPIKYWLWRKGWLPSPEVRLPMTPVSFALARRIDAAIAGRVRHRKPPQDETPAAAWDDVILRHARRTPGQVPRAEGP